MFPGTWSDSDCYNAVHDVLGMQAEYVWHKETDVSRYDCVILPGGFSYGDYLRPGAIARFSPIMAAVEKFAAKGGLVLGICNGFQILCESGLLPGTLMRNLHLEYRCQSTYLKIANYNTPFTGKFPKGRVLSMPISHGEGAYYTYEKSLLQLKERKQILLRYCSYEGEITDAANPNGSLYNIAGICNERGNVLGMMPHPERCCEDVLGGTDGSFLFHSIVNHALRVG